MVVFLFLKKRRNKVTNQSPDFADDTLNNDLNEKFSFKKLFGLKTTSGAGGVAGYNDLENLNSRAGVPLTGAYHDSTDDDFEYRGITNSNNLDSVFRSSASNTGQNSGGQTGGQNSSSASARGINHSRYNSVILPMAPMPEGPVEPSGYDPAVGGYHARAFSSGTEPGRSSDDIDDELFFKEAHAPFLSDEHHSNNSRLRFTEEI